VRVVLQHLVLPAVPPHARRGPRTCHHDGRALACVGELLFQLIHFGGSGCSRLGQRVGVVVAQLVKEVLEISVLVREVMSFELGLDPDGGDGEVPGCGECRPAREHEGQLWIAMDYIKITMDPQIVSVRKVTRIDLAVMGALAAPRPT